MPKVSNHTVQRPKIVQNQITGQPQPMAAKMVPLHNNLDLERGWQTSICHPSGTHQEQTAESFKLYSGWNMN
jgi:hypothetical protein